MAARLRRVDPNVWVILIGAAVVDVGGRLAGTAFNSDQISTHPGNPTWQLLDLPLLQHHLLGSVLSLQMQPPLYNLAIGLLLQFPGPVQRPVAEVVQFLLYTALCVLTYASMRELGIARGVGLLATAVLVVLDPAQFLYSMTMFYTTASAALMTCLGYLGIRLVKAPSASAAALFATCGTTLALFDTSLQPLVFIGMLAALILVMPEARRMIIKGTAVLVAILVLWTLHMTISFGTPATTTWLGMNISRVTTWPSRGSLVDTLVTEHHLTASAEVRPFSSLSTYGVIPDHTGTPALTEVTKVDGSPNMNNRAYIGVARASLTNAEHFIALEPSGYAEHVLYGMSIWFTPADQYFTLDSTAIIDYRSAYDRVVEWQPSPYRSASGHLLLQVPWYSRISYFQLVAGAVIAIGVPVVVITSWRRRRWFAIAVSLLAFLSLQIFAVTSITELGENNRFRFESGTIPITLLTVVVMAAARRTRALAGTR